MGSAESVSRDSACFCDFFNGGRLNGVQEVAGSNPVAPTSKARHDKKLRRASLLPPRPLAAFFAAGGPFLTSWGARSLSLQGEERALLRPATRLRNGGL